MNLALFPLPIFLLPGGVTRLRVFEPRYIRLVQESAGDKGFVIVPLKNLPALEAQSIDCHVNWGSWVKIIDFSQGSDGMLEIDVKCEAMTRLYNLTVEPDSLKRADAEVYNFWSQQSGALDSMPRLNFLTEHLKSVFTQNPQLAKLYPETKFDCPFWVCKRWLELLPLRQAEQNTFAQPDALSRARNFLNEIVFE